MPEENLRSYPSRLSPEKKLTGFDRTYQIRVGDYRVLYNIIENRLIVEIIRVGHRKDVYR